MSSFGQIGQWLERVHVKHEVVGSNPTRANFLYGIEKPWIPYKYNHLYKTTTRLKRPMLSPPNPNLMQSLLHKTTTYLTQPPTTFIAPQMKKTCVKQSLQNFI